MRYSQQEIANAKTSKSGKAYYTTNGQTIWVSKSAKSHLPMSYSYHEKSAVGKVMVKLNLPRVARQDIALKVVETEHESQQYEYGPLFKVSQGHILCQF